VLTARIKVVTTTTTKSAALELFKQIAVSIEFT
jgi:hypothetical protein